MNFLTEYEDAFFYFCSGTGIVPFCHLRWRSPQPVDASDAVFDAKSFGLPGLQSYDEGEVSSHGDMSEDCLHLNVWTTDLQMKPGRPVMVQATRANYDLTGHQRTWTL